MERYHDAIFEYTDDYSSDGKIFRFDYDYYQEADGWMKLHPIPAIWRDARLQCYREGTS